MSKLGARYTDDLIKERAESIGYTVTDIVREDNIPFVYMQCKCGANRTSRANVIQSASCKFCKGIRERVKDVVDNFVNKGFTINGSIEVHMDEYNNFYVKKNTPIDVLCEEGHNSKVKPIELQRGKECTMCKGTMNNIGFSRSEEIIHRLLDYHSIEHVRQYKLPEEYESLALDFYLPELNTIIEYDGDHHKYKRSDRTEKEFKETLRRDRLRDKYASDMSVRMIRIDGAVAGKEIIYGLHMLLSEHIGFKPMNDPYYDDIVREVFDECSRKYGWLSYDEVKESADIRKNHTWDEINRMEGRSVAVTNRHFRIIYGMTKQEFYG